MLYRGLRDEDEGERLIGRKGVCELRECRQEYGRRHRKWVRRKGRGRGQREEEKAGKMTDTNGMVSENVPGVSETCSRGSVDVEK